NSEFCQNINAVCGSALSLDAVRSASLHSRSAVLPRPGLREERMARIKHIALVTDDPVKTAEFYKSQFGLTELYRWPTDTGEKGVWLSDGYIYFAILKYGTGDAPKLGPGQTSDLRGIHHIGFQVDDIAATEQQLKAAGVRPVPMEPREPREAAQGAPPSEMGNPNDLGPADV